MSCWFSSLCFVQYSILMIENDWDSTEMRGLIKFALDEVAVDDEMTENILRNFFKKFRCRYAKWIWYSNYWADEIFDCSLISKANLIEKFEILLWIHHWRYFELWQEISHNLRITPTTNLIIAIKLNCASKSNDNCNAILRLFHPNSSHTRIIYFPAKIPK